MANSTNKELLEELASLTIQELIATIKAGEASPAVLNVARQLLKDNQITTAVNEETPLKELVHLLPFDEDGDTRKAQGL
tara:strand:- start:204 stop:440 length:237 start_codon:yes stop_codon:yes gene_type:complete